jgi:N-acetylneuraminic acid mutarotase
MIQCQTHMGLSRKKGALVFFAVVCCVTTSWSQTSRPTPTTATPTPRGTDTWTPTSITNAPTERYVHTAVWTGSEMIVWGGAISPPLVFRNSGGRYNPNTDTWVATSITNAPAARDLHTAIWTRSEMIIWGGYDGTGNLLNTGARYDPSTDTWVAISTIGAPSGRYGHTVVWTGKEMIVWGGLSGGSFQNTGGRYNPSTDTWVPTTITKAPMRRIGHTAVWTGSEMIVWGGGNDLPLPYGVLNTGGRYNPSTDTWIPTPISDAPSARQDHTAVWANNEMIVWGGAAGGVTTNTGGRYDPFTRTWVPTTTTNAPTSRHKHRAVWTGSEMVIWGGNYYLGTLNTGSRYNPITDIWFAVTNTDAPTRREYFTTVWTGSEMIVWGGACCGFPATSVNTGGRYCAQPSARPTSSPTAGGLP